MNTHAPSARELADALVQGGTYMIRAFRLHEDADVETLPAFVPTRLHVQHHKGQAVCVSPLDFDWAEADPRQEAYLRDGVLSLVVEDYQLDIEVASITARTPA
jgi:hypothetical protein